MPGDQKNPENKKGKIRWTLDKLVMGVIIGGAIGSVLGMAFAPRKGKETRRFLKEKGKELAESAKRESKNLYESIRERIDPENSENEDATAKIPTEKQDEP